MDSEENPTYKAVRGPFSTRQRVVRKEVVMQKDRQEVVRQEVVRQRVPIPEVGRRQTIAIPDILKIAVRRSRVDKVKFAVENNLSSDFSRLNIEEKTEDEKDKLEIERLSNIIRNAIVAPAVANKYPLLAAFNYNTSSV